MRFVFLLLALALLACSPRAGTRSDSAAGTVEPGTDIEVVRSAIDARLKLYLDALLKGDAATAASIYTDDAVSNRAGLEPIRGRPAIEKQHADWLASMRFGEAIGSTEELIPAGDTLTLEFGTYEWTFAPQGRAERRERGRYVNVWRRDTEGGWKIWREVMTRLE
jgi:ketosteroid isomerase-like protein